MQTPEQPEQVPKPAPPPQRQHDPELSNLEYVFGFRDAQFNAYMTSPNTKGESIGSLSQAGDAMAEHEHPVVRLAAAWAFAEAAMFRKSGKEDDRTPRMASRRNAALDNAHSLWRSSETDLAQLTRDTELDTVGLQLRTRVALIAMPALRTVVDWRSGKRPSLDDIASRVEPMHNELFEMSRELYTNWDADFVENPEMNAAMKQTRYGVAAENVAQLILQGYRFADGRLPFILAPASLRQDNNDDPRLRADLVAFDTEHFHKKLIQITSDKRPRARQTDTRFIIKRPDLQVEPYEGVRRTLETLIQRNSGESLEPGLAARLEAMSEDLGSGLVAFSPRHYYRRRRG